MEVRCGGFDQIEYLLVIEGWIGAPEISHDTTDGGSRRRCSVEFAAFNSGIEGAIARSALGQNVEPSALVGIRRSLQSVCCAHGDDVIEER